MTRNVDDPTQTGAYDGPEWLLKRFRSGRVSVYRQGWELSDAGNVHPPAAVDALARRAALLDAMLEVVIHDERENSSQLMWVSKDGPYSPLDPPGSTNHDAFKPPAKPNHLSLEPSPETQPSVAAESTYGIEAPAPVPRRQNSEKRPKRIGLILAAAALMSAVLIVVPIAAMHANFGSSGASSEPGGAGTSDVAGDVFEDTNTSELGRQKTIEDAPRSQSDADVRSPSTDHGSSGVGLQELEEELEAALRNDEDLPIGAGTPIIDEHGDPIQPDDPAYPSMRTNITAHPDPSTTERGPQADRIEVMTESDVRSVGFVIYAYGPSHDYGLNGPHPEVFLDGPGVDSQQVFLKARGRVISGEYVSFLGIGEVPSGTYAYNITYDGHTANGKVQAY